MKKCLKMNLGGWIIVLLFFFFMDMVSASQLDQMKTMGERIEAIASLLNHANMRHCHTGLYSTDDLDNGRLLNQILATLQPRSVLLVNDQLKQQPMAFDLYRQRHIFSKSTVKRSAEELIEEQRGLIHREDFWCLAWILVVRNGDQLDEAFFFLRREFRKSWTTGSHNKYIILVTEESEQAIINDPRFNTVYNMRNVFLFGGSNASHSPLTGFFFNPDKLTGSPNIYDRRALKPDTIAKMERSQKTKVAKVGRRPFDPYPDIECNLRGYPLAYSAMNWSLTFMVFDTEEGPILGDSVLKYILGMFSDTLNFSIDLRIAQDMTGGRRLPDGTWTGIMGQIVDETLDLSILTMSHERQLFADITQYATTETLTFGTSRPKPLPQWLSIFRPFNSILLWMLILGSVFLAATVLFFMRAMVKERMEQLIISCLPWDGENKYKDSLLVSWADNIFLGVNLLLTSPPDTSFTTRNGPTEFVTLNGYMAAFCFICFLLASFYRCSLTSHLTSPAYDKPINSLQGASAKLRTKIYPRTLANFIVLLWQSLPWHLGNSLPRSASSLSEMTRLTGHKELAATSDYSWGVSRMGTAEYGLIATATTPTYRAILKQMQICPDPYRCLLETQDKKFAFISITNLQRQFIAEYMSTKEGQQRVITAKEEFSGPLFTTFTLKQGGHFLPELLRIGSRIIQGGLYDKWEGHFFRVLQRRGRRRALVMEQMARQKGEIEDEDAEAGLRLSLYHLQAAFFLLFSGLALAAMAFIVEVVANSYSKRSGRPGQHTVSGDIPHHFREISQTRRGNGRDSPWEPVTID